MKYLVFDISNVLYRTFFANKQQDDMTIAGLAMHSALVTLNKYYKKYKPDKIVMAFDRSSWRKDYTASSKCVSKNLYKGNRRKDMSISEQLKYQKFIDHLRDFETLITDYTTVITLQGEKLEADDLIAAFVQQNSDDEITIISSDTDLLQLLKHSNVTIITPDGDKVQTLEEFDNDPNYYLFVKCIRGDKTDNVGSAYPRVKTTRLKKAYEDPFERLQLMKEYWKSVDGVEHQVEKLFEENCLLIDLERQPEVVREYMKEVLNEELEKKRKFSLFHLMKFIGKYQLVKVKDNIDTYIPMLSR